MRSMRIYMKGSLRKLAFVGDPFKYTAVVRLLLSYEPRDIERACSRDSCEQKSGVATAHIQRRPTPL